MAENLVQGDMDSEIAALLGTGANAGAPDKTGEQAEAGAGEPQGATAGAAGFPEITRRFEEKPHAFFSDPNYYKAALSGEGDIAQRVHGILQKFLTAKDPKDRSVFRQQFINPFWDFLLGVAKKRRGK